MSHIDDEGTAPVASSGDRSDAALDAAFSAANAGMVAAIRQGFDLDAGLARIIGAPPQVEIRSPGSPEESNWGRLLTPFPPGRMVAGRGWIRTFAQSMSVLKSHVCGFASWSLRGSARQADRPRCC